MRNNILLNAPLISAFIAWLVAQFLKPFVSKAMGQGFNPHMFLSTGGMPSSHTATVIALTTSIGVQLGMQSYAFAICLVFSIIVIHDAMNIRLEAGKQADVINEWSKILSEMHKDGPFKQEHLKTMLGHSFSQVFAGLLLGIVIGLVTTWVING